MCPGTPGNPCDEGGVSLTVRGIDMCLKDRRVDRTLELGITGESVPGLPCTHGKHECRVSGSQTESSSMLRHGEMFFPCGNEKGGFSASLLSIHPLDDSSTVLRLLLHSSFLPSSTPSTPQKTDRREGSRQPAFTRLENCL